MATRRSETRRIGTLGLFTLACFLWLTAPARAQQLQCVGDCDHSDSVIVNELVECVDIALSSAALSTCPVCSSNGQTVSISDLVTAVNNALDGCPTGGTPGATKTATASPTVAPTVNPCPLQPGTYTITTLAGGKLTVSTFKPFAFPPGGTITADVGAGDANCVHNVVVPAENGFTSPEFCVPALGATVRITQSGCGIGQIDSNGGSDYTVTEIGDTSFKSATCDVHQDPPCNVAGPAPDQNILVRATVGDGTPDVCTGGGTVNSIISIPVQTLTWVENAPSPGECPATDGTYDPDKGDALLSNFPQTLDFTSDKTSTKFQDLDGDGCSKSGLGPANGYSMQGSCLDLSKLNVSGATAGVNVASGTVGGTNNPWDLAFLSVLPNQISGPQPTIGATCATPPLIDFHGTVDRCIIAPVTPE